MKKTLLLLFIVAGISTTFGQNSFHRIFGEDEFDYANDVAELPDSGFLIAGTSGSFNIGHADAFLMRTDKLGNWLWSIPYGGIENDGANALEYLENFGAYLMGRTTSSSGDFDAWITFVNEQGDIIWEKTYPGPDWEEITNSTLAQDSGVVVSVKRFGTGTLGDDYSLMRLDAVGDTVWSMETSNPGDEEVTNIVKYQDSMFLVSSNHWDEVGMRHFGYIELIHENGMVVWGDTVDVSPGSVYLNGFFVANDTLFGVGGFKLDDTSTYNRMRHIRYIPLAENGEILTMVSNSGGDLYDELVIPVPNTSFCYSSLYFSDPTVGTPPHHDFFVSLNSNLLVPISVTAYSATYGEDRLNNAIVTQDGGAIFVGYQSLTSGNSDISLVKIGPGFDYPVISPTPLTMPLVGNEELDELITVNVYPNPANETVTVEVSNEISDNYCLINLEGQKLISGRISAENTLISVGNLTAGMYLLQLYKDNDLKGTKAIIVQ